MRLDLPRCAGYLAWEMSSSSPEPETVRGRRRLTKIALCFERMKKLKIHDVLKNDQEPEVEELGLHRGLSQPLQTCRAGLPQAKNTAPPHMKARR